MSYAQRLAKMDDEWQEAQAASGGVLPPGNYQARIDRILIEESNWEKLQLRTEYVVTHGEHEGRRTTSWNDLEDPERLKYAKSHLLTLGIELTSLAELESRLPEVLDAVVEIRVKQSTSTNAEGQPYINTYCNRLISKADQPTSTAQSKSVDDIPF